MQNLPAGSAERTDGGDVTFLNEVILLLVPRKLDPHGDDKGTIDEKDVTIQGRESNSDRTVHNSSATCTANFYGASERSLYNLLIGR